MPIVLSHVNRSSIQSTKIPEIQQAQEILKTACNNPNLAHLISAPSEVEESLKIIHFGLF